MIIYSEESSDRNISKTKDIFRMNFLVRLVSIDLLLGSSYNVKIQKFADS